MELGSVKSQMLNEYNWKSLFATLCCTTRAGTPSRDDAGTQGIGQGRGSDLWQHALNIWVIHTYIGRVVSVCVYMYLHLFLGWHTNRFFAHSSHGNVDVNVVMLPFSYLQLFTLCQTNKHNQPYTHMHAQTRADSVCARVHVCVFVRQNRTTWAQQ